MRQFKNAILFVLAIVSIGFAFDGAASAQNSERKQKKPQTARPVTIPISISAENVKTSAASRSGDELIDAGNLTVKENNVERTILSLRSTVNSPLQFAVLIQDNLASEVNLELEGIAQFIRRLPRGSRVFVGYLSGGSVQVRQKFTEDLERAANSLRVITGSSASAPPNPYVGVIETVRRFDNLPNGRRAMLVVSDGLDTLRGIESASPGQSVDLDRAVLRAQRNGIAAYSIYAGSSATGSSLLTSYGQGSLNRLSEETGGRAFFQGTGTPVSFAPFLRQLGVTLSRQFALTYLSTNTGNEFRRIEVTSDNPQVKVEHSKGVAPR